MRGLLMLLVVMEHSSTHLFGTFDGFSTVHTYMVYIVQFMMPAFFFVCGFVLFRAKMTWSLLETKRLLKGKICSQIISPCLFFLLYIYVSSISLRDGVFEYHKVGYWFTFTLFGFYILFSIVLYLSNLFKVKSVFTDILLIVIGLILFYFAIVVSSFESLRDISGLLGVYHWNYFIYMALGYLVHKYQLLQKNKRTEIVCAICILLYLVLNIFYLKIDNSYVPLRLMQRFLLGISGTILLYAFFFYKEDAIKDTKVGKCLQYIGKRTLCIYYVNFLLLPVQLHSCTLFLREYPMPLVELFLAFILAALNIVVCLIIYNVIFLSQPLGEFLFGKNAISKT